MNQLSTQLQYNIFNLKWTSLFAARWAPYLVMFPAVTTTKKPIYFVCKLFVMCKIFASNCIFQVLIKVILYKQYGELKVAFFQKVRFVFQISKSQKKYSKKTILSLKFKFPANNSKVFWAGNLNFKFRIVFWNIFFGDFEI